MGRKCEKKCCCEIEKGLDHVYFKTGSNSAGQWAHYFLDLFVITRNCCLRNTHSFNACFWIADYLSGCDTYADAQGCLQRKKPWFRQCSLCFLQIPLNMAFESKETFFPKWQLSNEERLCAQITRQNFRGSYRLRNSNLLIDSFSCGDIYLIHCLRILPQSPFLHTEFFETLKQRLHLFLHTSLSKIWNK